MVRVEFVRFVPVVIALLCVLVSPSTACFEYEQATRWTGAVRSTNMSLALSEDHAFGCADGQFSVFSVSPDGELSEVALLHDPSIRWSPVVAAEDLVAVIGWDGLILIDTSVETDPEIVAALDTPGQVQGICLVPPFLAVADDAEGLQIVAIGGPGGPAVVGHLPLPGRALCVGWSGTHLCVGTDESFHVVAIDGAGRPELLGSVSTPAFELSARVALAAVNDGTGTQLIDIGDPGPPVLRGRIGAIEGPVFYGNRLLGVLVDEESRALCMIDTTNPDAPRIETSVDFPDVVLRAAANDDHIAVTTRVTLAPHHFDYAIHLIDVGSGGFAPERAAMQVSCPPLDVARAGGYLWVADPPCPLLAIPSPSDHNASESIPLEDLRNTHGLEVEGSLAYLARGAEGFSIMNVSAPLAPVLLGSAPTPGGAVRLLLRGSHVYVGTDTGHLSVFDVSDPTNPGLVSDQDLGGEITKLKVGGSHLLVIAGGDLRFLDVSDPASPVLVGTYDDESAYDVATQNGILFVASSEHPDFGLIRVFDWTDPADLAPITTLDCPDNPEGLLCANGILYAACGSSGTSIIDVRDPIEPRVIGWHLGVAHDMLPAEGGAYALGDDRVLWIADACSGSQLVDVVAAPLRWDMEVVPNPMRSGCEVRFQLTAPGPASADVIDPSGRRLRSLLLGDLPAGEHVVVWDGRNDAGARVSSGAYIVHLRTPDAVHSVRVVCID